MLTSGIEDRHGEGREVVGPEDGGEPLIRRAASHLGLEGVAMQLGTPCSGRQVALSLHGGHERRADVPTPASPLLLPLLLLPLLLLLLLLLHAVGGQGPTQADLATAASHPAYGDVVAAAVDENALVAAVAAAAAAGTEAPFQFFLDVKVKGLGTEKLQHYVHHLLQTTTSITAKDVESQKQRP